jgi:hypothetical protein
MCSGMLVQVCFVFVSFAVPISINPAKLLARPNACVGQPVKLAQIEYSARNIIDYPVNPISKTSAINGTAGVNRPMTLCKSF